MNSENTNDILNNDGVENDNGATKTMLRSTFSSDDTMTVTAPDKPKTEPSGGRDKDNNSSGNGVSVDPAFERQLLAIKNDPVVRARLKNIIRTIRLFNPNAKIKGTGVDELGYMSLEVYGLSVAQVSVLDFQGVIVAVEGEAAGGIYTGHKLGKVDKPLPNNKDKLSEAEITTSLLGATISALQGEIPAGYLLQDGNIGYMKAVYSKTSLGHGEWQENYSGTKFTESPELTKDYNEGIKQKKEADTNRAKELAEAKSLGITDVEYDVLKAVRQAQNELNLTTQKIAKATTDKSNAEKAVAQQEAVVKAALESRDIALHEQESHEELSPEDFKGRTWWAISYKIAADVKAKQNALDEANNKLNSLKKDVTQAELDIKKAKDESVSIAAVKMIKKRQQRYFLHMCQMAYRRGEVARIHTDCHGIQPEAFHLTLKPSNKGLTVMHVAWGDEGISDDAVLRAKPPEPAAWAMKQVQDLQLMLNAIISVSERESQPSPSK